MFKFLFSIRQRALTRACAYDLQPPFPRTDSGKPMGKRTWLDGKHGVGVPESEPRSRSPGVGVPESDVIKIWKRRSHMENTESDVREKYGKHGVIWKTRSLTS